MKTTYYVQEFAKLAGVTVRTLHYYDQTGLLKPSRRSSSKHRLYQQSDLLRLQQILTLKAMGFSLDEIRDLLESPAYNVQKSLRIQKEAIDRRIEQLQQVSRALEKTLEMVGDDRQVDWVQVAAIIRIVSADDKQEWIRQYFSDEQLDQLAAREIPQEVIRAGERAWMALIEDFRRYRHLAPDHPDVQQLAGRMVDLIGQFTGGDAGIRASLEAMYSDFEQMPPEYRMYGSDLNNFMGEAFRIYEDRARIVKKS